MNTQHILSYSYGKDSGACIEAIMRLGWPLDGIVTADVWFDDDTPADLPPMMEFKNRADAIILERYGIEVKHTCAMCKDGTKMTYIKGFYHVPKRKPANVKDEGRPKGFPNTALTRGVGLVQDSQIQRHGDFRERQTGAADRSNGPQWWGFPIRHGGWCHDLKAPQQAP